jgi:VWFA-related protein
MILQSLSSFPGDMLTGGAPTPARARTPLPSDEAGRQQASPKGDFTIKTNAVLVTVDAIVRTEKGGFVGDLQAEDFAIYDNGVAQQITLFSTEQLPLAVALVVDRSPSVQPFLPQLRTAALTALQRLKPEDQVGLFTFDMKSARLSDLTDDHMRIAQMVSQIPGGMGTNIYDPLFDAAHYLHLKAPDQRRSIILVSDNYQSVPSDHNFREILQEALEAGVTLYSLRTPGDNPGVSDQGDPSSIGRIALETGGEILDAGTGKLAEAMDMAIMNLKHGYLLGFTPSDQGKEGSYHRLIVKLTSGQRCPWCSVQARSGYYAGAQAPTPTKNSSRGAGKTDSKSKTLPIDFEELIAQNRIYAARNISSDLRDIPFEISTTEVQDAKGKPQVKVDLQIIPANVFFKILDDRHAARLRITTFYQDAKGKPLGADWKIMDMSLSEGTYQRILQSGIPYSTTIPLKTPKQIIKVVVYDPGSDRSGSRLVKLQ